MFSGRLNLIDRPMAKGKSEVMVSACWTLRNQDTHFSGNLMAFLACDQVSLSAFSFLFSEMVQYSQTQVSNIGELERR